MTACLGAVGAALDGWEGGEFENDAPVAVFADAFDGVTLGGVGVAADGDFGPITVGAGGQLFGAVGEREVGRRDHFFGRDFAAGDGAGTFGALRQVSARVDPQQLVSETRGAPIAVDSLHAVDELLDDSFGRGVFGFGLAACLRQAESDRGDEPSSEGASRGVTHRGHHVPGALGDRKYTRSLGHSLPSQLREFGPRAAVQIRFRNDAK